MAARGRQLTRPLLACTLFDCPAKGALLSGSAVP